MNLKKTTPFIGAIIGVLYALIEYNGKHVVGYAVVGAIIAQVLIELVIYLKKVRRQ